MSWEQAEIRELKVNRYIVVDDEPCRILSIQTSKPGKHGEAKARLEVVGLFDGQKRSVVHPVTHKVRIPMIDKGRRKSFRCTGTSRNSWTSRPTRRSNFPCRRNCRASSSPARKSCTWKPWAAGS